MSDFLNTINSYLGSIPESWRYGLLILLVIVIIILVANCFSSSCSSSGGVNQTKIQNVLQNASRWQATANQDSNALFALMHANYAIAYANVARLLMNDDEIKKVTSIDMPEFMMKLEHTQQTNMRNITAVYPDLQPNNDYAVSTGWLA